ncbi:dehydrogenase, partial [Nonomuraea sp. KC401]|uniref:cupredoxin domain-containing protein n=2 Tax=unclassified Nonomuraea TaxID=2593643 RepID=UPI001274751F
PKKRNDIRAAALTGTTITLGRIWDASNQQPGATENTVAQNAMSPQHLRVPKGTTVTFVNPADNANAHAAVSFFEYEFDTGVLMPGQSSTHTFDTPGEYFYNDAIFPQSTGKIVVY